MSKERYEEEKRRLTEEKFSPQRGENFVRFITKILKERAKLPDEKISSFLAHVKIFEQAFTAKSYNPEWNYEALEILGDSICNFCVMQYLTERFPHLMKEDGSGVTVLSRLKINLISKEVFSSFAEKLGFTDHVASNRLQRRDEMRSLLEDTFEAFQGALIKISGMIDPGSDRKGYLPSLGPSYRIVSSLLSELEISLKYEDLYDVKTRLKQILEKSRLEYPTFKVKQELTSNGKIVFTTYVHVKSLGQLGVGEGFYKNVSEQNACENAIKYLKLAGYTDLMILADPSNGNRD